jgi:hypothetical protein
VSVLGAGQIARYTEAGFVRVEGAVPRALALRCRARLWDAIEESPDDRQTWTRPVTRVSVHDAPELAQAASQPRWREAIFEVAGADADPTPWLGGSTAVRFPVAGDPGDDGWHIDGSFPGSDGAWWVNFRSRGRALLMLVLFSDVGPNDAPTRLRAGSHRVVPAALRSYGDAGVAALAFPIPAPVDDLPVELATGEAGDVYLCHPFLVHAAQRHHGREPRFVSQPGVPWRDGVDGFPD